MKNHQSQENLLREKNPIKLVFVLEK
jgi:hypothetical protein